MSQASGNKHRGFGDDATADSAASRQAIKHVQGTGGAFVDGVLSGFAWQSNNITYAFPNNRGDYHYGPQPDHGFGAVSGKIRAAAAFILDKDYGGSANDGFSVEGFTNLHISRGSESGATIRYAESSYRNPSSYAFLPTTDERGGDVWIGPFIHHYSNAVSGNYQFQTIIHETGHALGLKHGHERENHFPKIPDKWDAQEYSVMTYRGHLHGPNNYGDFETFGLPQTFMMADIAALQHMYGANFKVNAGKTVYSWNPNDGDTLVNGKAAINAGSDNIFATIWDGGGHDTYDLSAYHNNLSLDLHSGGRSVFSQSQLARLGGNHLPSGNIYNALTYHGDKRSLIEDAIGGSGNDLIWGNEIRNRLVGNSGNDELSGWQGDDRLIGGSGNDTFIFKRGWDHDTVEKLDGHDRVDLRSFNFAGFGQLMAHAHNDDGGVSISFGNGDILTINHVQTGDLHGSDFIL